MLKLVPRHEFEALANRHHSGRCFRTASRWSQFVTITEGKEHDVTVGRKRVIVKSGV
ncbi:MAG: DUF4372 domain-containing protein [Candidatus Thiodiazotropha sp. (ex Rostrolucina anterorostrata)]|nr:DUF4372 domain-containing protein [Candidatus Thiodiazotropha sp. (ex Rostrolucina anterorostrata)]